MKNTYNVMFWHCLRECYTDTIWTNIKASCPEEACEIVNMQLNWENVEDAGEIELEAELVEWGDLNEK